MHYSEQDIAALLDRLIDAKADADDHSKVYGDYSVSHPYPRPPESFDSVQALKDYNERKARWELESRGFREHALAASRRLEGVTERIKEVLPRDASVTHTYGGKAEHRGGRYRISNPVLGIQIQKLNADDS